MTDITPNDFTSFIINFEQSLPFLPLLHTTDAFHFKEILKRELLEPEKCDVFDEKLLYFFYGYPAYRVNSGTISRFHGKLPIVIILYPDAVKYAKRVFPFDSGAYNNGLFPEYMYDNFTIKSFMAEPYPEFPGCIPIPDIPSRIVSAFFQNNINYYYANKLRIFSGSELLNCHEAECHYELNNTKSESESDERRGIIEIQTVESVTLSKDSVWAVVLPESSLDNKILTKTVVEIWQAKPIPYRSYKRNPSFFIPIIVEEVCKFLISERGLK